MRLMLRSSGFLESLFYMGAFLRLLGGGMDGERVEGVYLCKGMMVFCVLI